MRQYTADNLVIHPGNSADPDVIVEVRPEDAGWETIAFQARRLAAGAKWSSSTGTQELALTVLGGTLNLSSNRGSWHGLGQRADVFSGLPTALYLPPGVDFTITAINDCEFAIAQTEAGTTHHPPRLVTPLEVTVEIRGGDQATRRIHNIIPPGFPCERLVVVEVFTPGGNWSSYPPHKHDIHRSDAEGQLLEADLDEIYYYRSDRPEGYALQRIYTGPTSPLQQAGLPIDAAVVARNNDVILVPEGYHPVTSPVGYTTYYLNILAGSAQSLASYDDPTYAWVKASYTTRDPRVEKIGE